MITARGDYNLKLKMTAAEVKKEEAREAGEWATLHGDEERRLGFQT